MRANILTIYVIGVLVFLAAPVLIVIPSAFGQEATLAFPPIGFTMKWFGNILAHPELISAFGNSVAIALMATAVSLVVGTMTVLALRRYEFPGREALRMLFLAPLVCPAIVLATAVAMVLSPLGLIRTFTGLVVAHTLVTLPYIVRTVGASLAGLDVALEEAALTLGATPWQRFRTITLPLLSSGLLVGATFSLIISFDEFTLSLFIVGNGMMTLPLEMFNYVEFSIDPTIAAVSTILVLITTAAILLIEKLGGLGRQFGQAASGGVR